MSDEEKIRAAFIKNCSNPQYFYPQITKDDVWLNAYNTMKKFSFTKDYDNFCSCLNNCYGGDVMKFTSDIAEFQNKLIKTIDTSTSVIEMANKTTAYDFLPKRVNEINDGEYVSLDIKNGIFQTLSFYGIIEEGCLDNLYSNIKYGNYFKKIKGIQKTAYNNSSSLLAANKFLYKNMLWEAINGGDELFSDINKNGTIIAVIGDNAVYDIKCKDYEKYFGTDYKTSNGIVFHFNTMKVICHNINGYEIKECTIGDNEPIYYSSCISKKVPYELYPQIYKYLNGIEIIQEDLAYGYLNNVKYFTKKIWEY